MNTRGKDITDKDREYLKYLNGDIDRCPYRAIHLVNARRKLIRLGLLTEDIDLTASGLAEIGTAPEKPEIPEGAEFFPRSKTEPEIVGFALPVEDDFFKEARDVYALFDDGNFEKVAFSSTKELYRSSIVKAINRKDQYETQQGKNESRSGTRA